MLLVLEKGGSQLCLPAEYFQTRIVQYLNFSNIQVEFQDKTYGISIITAIFLKI